MSLPDPNTRVGARARALSRFDYQSGRLVHSFRAYWRGVGSGRAIIGHDRFLSPERLQRGLVSDKPDVTERIGEAALPVNAPCCLGGVEVVGLPSAPAEGRVRRSCGVTTKSSTRGPGSGMGGSPAVFAGSPRKNGAPSTVSPTTPQSSTAPQHRVHAYTIRRRRPRVDGGMSEIETVGIPICFLRQAGLRTKRP